MLALRLASRMTARRASSRRLSVPSVMKAAVVREPGAVGTRVATSFLRFGQLEIFSQRGETDLLVELVEHALTREFAHLMVQHPGEARTELYVRMFEEVCERQAHLVAEWLRVGYGQG